MRKVAIVDLDGCLVEDGKINLALVERLRQYDQVIFFTQRSKWIQCQQITRTCLQEDYDASSIVTTVDAIEALKNLAYRPVYRHLLIAILVNQCSILSKQLV